MTKVPTRSLGKPGGRLPPQEVPIIGLGCSSFSHFFWSRQEKETDTSLAEWQPQQITRDHPRVQEWIQTIHHAIQQGIFLLDTAPWYGHGTSETVIGWALQELMTHNDNTTTPCDRSTLVINTKIGRYESDPQLQFDFSYDKTLSSCQTSIQRMHCDYINTLQLHDPEFAPSLDVLMMETIPAMLECRKRGWCKALGMTGFPLKTQYQIIQRSLELFPDECVWDQSLTYGHYSLVDSSLVDRPIQSSDKSSFAEYCDQHKIGLIAAAPLAIGLFSSHTLPDWHPASPELIKACQQATQIAVSLDVDITTLALLFALDQPARIPCTLLGMKNVTEVKTAVQCAQRFEGDGALVWTAAEQAALTQIRDPETGPFAALWKNGLFTWDGVAEAQAFWKQVDGVEPDDWHLTE